MVSVTWLFSSFFQKKKVHIHSFICVNSVVWIQPSPTGKFGSLPNILQLKPPKEGRSKLKQESRDRSQSITILQQEQKKYNISEIKDNSAISNNIYRQLCYCRNAFHSSFYMDSCSKFVTSVYLGFLHCPQNTMKRYGGGWFPVTEWEKPLAWHQQADGDKHAVRIQVPGNADMKILSV